MRIHLTKLFVVALLCSSVTGCVKHVTASCQPEAPTITGFDAIETQGLGFLNIAGYPVGKVFELDPDVSGSGAYFANPVDLIQFTPGSSSPDYSEAPPQDVTVQVAVAWSLSGDVQNGSKDSVTIQAAIDNSLTFKVSNGIQAAIRNTLVSLNSQANSNLKSLILAHPKLTYLVLNPVELGDKLDLALAQDTSVNTDVKLGWTVTADVSYKCNAETTISSIPSGPHSTLIIYPEFIQAVNGTIDHVGGSSGSHLFSATATSHVANAVTPAHGRRSTRKTQVKIVVCKPNGNDLTRYPGCKNP